MRKLWLKAVFLMALLLAVSFAFMSLAADSYESILVGNTAVGFTSANITTTTYLVRKVFCTEENGAIRYRVDGTSPTSAEGHWLAVSGTLTIDNYTDILNFRAISASGTSPTLKCSYWK